MLITRRGRIAGVRHHASLHSALVLSLADHPEWVDGTHKAVAAALTVYLSGMPTSVIY